MAVAVVLAFVAALVAAAVAAAVPSAPPGMSLVSAAPVPPPTRVDFLGEKGESPLSLGAGTGAGMAPGVSLGLLTIRWLPTNAILTELGPQEAFGGGGGRLDRALPLLLPLLLPLPLSLLPPLVVVRMLTLSLLVLLSMSGAVAEVSVMSVVVLGVVLGTNLGGFWGGVPSTAAVAATAAGPTAPYETLKAAGVAAGADAGVLRCGQSTFIHDRNSSLPSPLAMPLTGLIQSSPPLASPPLLRLPLRCCWNHSASTPISAPEPNSLHPNPSPSPPLPPLIPGAFSHSPPPPLSPPLPLKGLAGGACCARANAIRTKSSVISSLSPLDPSGAARTDFPRWLKGLGSGLGLGAGASRQGWLVREILVGVI